MTDISYDAKKNSKELTDYADEDNNGEVEVDQDVADKVFEATRRVTVKGFSAEEIRQSLHHDEDELPDLREVEKAVECWRQEDWLVQTGFEDQEGRPRYTNEHLFHQHKRTRQEIKGGDEK